MSWLSFCGWKKSCPRIKMKKCFWVCIHDCKITHLRLHLDNSILQRKAMNGRHHGRRRRQPIQSMLKHSIHSPKENVNIFFPRVFTGIRIHIHKKHGQTIKWVLSIFPCSLCSALPRFLFRLTIECTREYKKLDTIWSKSGCYKKIIEWMAMEICEKHKIRYHYYL